MIKLANLLTEVGEGVAPYKFRRKGDSRDEHKILYTFSTDDGEPYTVFFHSGYAHLPFYNLSYFPGDDAGSKIDTITNKGFVYKILSTVVAIVKDFIAKNKKATAIKFVGVNTPGKDKAADQRDKLYAAYVKKNMQSMPNWKIETIGAVTYLQKINTK